MMITSGNDDALILMLQFCFDEYYLMNIQDDSIIQEGVFYDKQLIRSINSIRAITEIKCESIIRNCNIYYLTFCFGYLDSLP